MHLSNMIKNPFVKHKIDILQQYTEYSTLTDYFKVLNLSFECEIRS